MSLKEALTYDPTDLTYAIRIFRSDMPNWNPSLMQSEFYVAERRYAFDHVEPSWEQGNDKSLDEQISGTIIQDFIDGRGGCATLLVHCLAGKNRSPAVAIALNELFNLGHDGDLLRNKFPRYLRESCELMIGVGREMGLT